MKKIFFTAATLALLMAVPQDAQAQGFLKKLKDKVEQKVDKAVGDAVGGALGKKAKANDNSSRQAVSNGDGGYASEGEAEDSSHSLMYVKKIITFSFFDLFSIGGNSDNAKPLNMTAAMAAGMGFFNATDAVDDAGIERLKAEAEKAKMVLNGFFNYTTALSMERSKAHQKYNQNPVKGVSQESKQVMQNFTQELMAYMQKKGVDMQNIDEAKMEKIAAEFMAEKIGIPAEELAKVKGMSDKEAEAYLSSKYPAAKKKAAEMGLIKATEEYKGQETDNDLYLKLHDELHAIIEAEQGSDEENLKKLENQISMATDESVDVAQRMINYHKGLMADDEKKMLELHNEIVDSWESSEACKKVNQMENDLSKRLDKWMEDNNTNYNNTFPAWWKTTKQDINKVIRAWNIEQVERWNEALKSCDRKGDYIKKLIDFEAKLDAEKGNIAEHQYADLKYSVNNCIFEMTRYLSLPFAILECPQADYVSEMDPGQ